MSSRTILYITFGVALFSLQAPRLLAESPQFRGPAGNGVFEKDQNIPLKWGADSNVKWKASVPGHGWSSPVVWGDKVFITTAVEEKPESESAAKAPEPPRRPESRRGSDRQGESRVPDKGLDKVFSWEVHCLDRLTGTTLWKKTAFKGNPPIPTHRSNTYASETPVTDGKRLYVYFGMVGVFCYEFDGELAWKKDLGAYPMRQGWGTASSPALHDGHLFILVDSEEDSFLVGLSTSDGKEAWRFERPDEPSSWGSPVIWKNKLRAELIVGGGIVRSHEPATGKVLWELDTNGGQTSATPCGNSERLIIGTEFRRAKRGREENGGMLCSVRPGASGDITPDEGETTTSSLHWIRERGGPEMSSPLIYRGYVYILERSDMLNCYSAETGERVFERTRVKGARAFWSSPWAHDGHVYFLDESGAAYVIEPANEYKELSVNKLDDKFWASSAVSDGTLILRGVDGIYCIGR